MPEAAITERLAAILQQGGLPPARHSSPLAGGDTGHSVKVTLEDNRTVFIKWADAAPGDIFTAEAAGLDALRALVPLNLARVPEVYHAATDGLVLEWLPPGARQARYWERFGEALAAIHAEPQDHFGFARDNYCGLTPQPNPAMNDGYHFFAEARLQHQAKMARDRGRLSWSLCRKVDRLCERLDRWIPTQPPVLIHGDLWSGNAHVGPGGEPVLIDPAAHYGWAEADLAMTTLFGRFDPDFYSSYMQRTDIATDWEERAGLYNLYHLLNHLNLFGASYHSSVQQVLDRWT
ncbi:MAG: fructosamine kinase [Alteromonadaceae bacterium]|nr:fructosamine kinase [Alteromonadaceae bacterium]